MGLGQNGKKVLYTATGLTRNDIVTIGLKKLQLKGTGANGATRPVIDVDCNNVINIVGRKSVGAVTATANHLVEWAQHGCVMSPICDGETRPVAKQASIKNRAKRERSKHTAVIKRRELRDIAEQLGRGDLDAAARDGLEKTRGKLEKTIKTAETQATNIVPANFPQMLQEELRRISARNTSEAGGGGSVGQVLTAEFQADSLMTGRYLSGQCQFLMSNDADFLVENGDECIALVEFTGKTVSIRSSSKKTLEEAMSYLEPESQSKIKLELPAHPIFEGVADRRTRVLISVIIGCDVSPGGVKGAGPSWVETTMKEIQLDIKKGSDTRPLYDQLIDHAVEKSRPRKNDPPQYSKEVLDTLVDAIMYEPSNVESVYGVAPKRTYKGNIPDPVELSDYLGEFKGPSTIIKDGPSVLRCKGTCIGDCHNFLAAEDHYTCASCNQTICHLCTAHSERTDCCLPCYVVESLLPGEDAPEAQTIAQMRDELKTKYNFDGADKLSVEEVEEAWTSHALHRSIEELADSIQFPVCPTTALDSGEYWDEIADIDFSFGGSFLLNSEIEDENIPAILELFASFVYFDASPSKHTNWDKDGSVYAAMPKMFVDFAKNCRVDVGYRLLRRCLRHALDSRTELLDNKVAKLIMYNGKLGIQIDTPIPASMKKDVYDGTTVVTKDEILCTSCGCKSGSKGTDRVACVHSMPRPFMLTLLICEDLAEHMLLELTSIVTSADVENDTWGKEGVKSMKQSVLTLIKACGSASLADQVEQQPTLFDMLQSFRTGTQRKKEWNRVHTPPKEDEIGPISEIVFDSPEHKAKVKLNRAKVKPNLDPKEEIVDFTPDYIQTGIVLNAAGITPSSYEYVGFQLFESRRREQPHDPNLLPKKIKEAQLGWASLMSEAYSRSTRRSTTQMANMHTPSRGNAVTPTPVKRKSYDTRSRVAELETKRKKKCGAVSGASFTCAKEGCDVTTKAAGVSFHRIPPFPKDIPSEPTKEQLLTRRGKLELRCEAMDRIGRGRNDRTEGLRVCSLHPFETLAKRLYVTFKGAKVYQTFEFSMISGAGVNSSLNPSEMTKGVGCDRYAQNAMNFLQNESKKAASSHQLAPSLLPETPLDKAERLRREANADAAAAQLIVQQVVECHSPSRTSSSAPKTLMCPAVAKAAGFVPFNMKSGLHPRQQSKFSVKRIGRPFTPSRAKSSSTPKKAKGSGLGPTPTKNTSDGSRQMNANLPPKVVPTIDASEVKRRTAFNDASNMIGYVVLICNGDFDRIRKRHSPLTWFEEWFLYFEWKWHETNRRIDDMEAEWGINRKYISRIKDGKAALEMACLRSWPRFATYQEDLSLRNREKWRRYDGYRPIMWDMTGISAVAFSDASLQRATYSEYYGENCFKGGIFCQLCGWVGNEDLWGGGVSDSDYNKKAGYLQAQNDFQETDLVDGEVKKFHNILDRGYRGKMAAWQCGQQMALQPPSAKSDQRFQGKQTIYAGCIAHDRSGNERGVSVCKRSGLMSRGFREGMSAKRFNYAWRTWGFQANFMYKPVL